MQAGGVPGVVRVACLRVMLVVRYNKLGRNAPELRKQALASVARAILHFVFRSFCPLCGASNI